MRFLVFSDTHGHIEKMSDIIAVHKPAAVFHLGDYVRDAHNVKLQFPDLKFYTVRGNGDFFAPEPDSMVVQEQQKKVFLCHGHLFSVKAGTQSFLQAAKAGGADIALYGHTHRACSFYEDGMYVLNPGSLTMPQEGIPTYGIIDITPSGVMCFAANWR